MTRNCLLVAGRDGRAPTAAAQFSQLRTFQVEQYPMTNGVFSRCAPALVAMHFRTLEGLDESQKSALRAAVEQGTTAYLRGSPPPGRRYSLEPFAQGWFVIGSEHRARSHFFARHPTIPGVLQGEQSECELSLPGVDEFSGAIEGLLLARHIDGRERPVIFALECGAGRVIYDLQQEDGSVDHHDVPIVRRLADRRLRCGEVGALIAVERACCRDLQRRSPINLTIDDRPANYDYLSAGRLRVLLEHMAGRLPDFHIDFAWTPSEIHPSRRYVEVLKEFGAGFVWHGLHRHVDHSLVADPAVDFAAGRYLVDSISRRFAVDFQPVMIFPFEGVGRASEEVLKRAGFVAKSEMPGADVESEKGIPQFLRYSSPPSRISTQTLTVLYRYEATRLDRDSMLAHAALGLPIIAMGHPRDVGLKRFARFRSETVVSSYFDHVLDFGAEKGLRPMSLEQIARDAIETSMSPSETREVDDCCTTV
jgi:hypothetical protein